MRISNATSDFTIPPQDIPLRSQMNGISEHHKIASEKLLGKSEDQVKDWIKPLPEGLKGILVPAGLDTFMEAQKINSITLAIISEGKITAVYTVTKKEQCEMHTLEESLPNADVDNKEQRFSSKVMSIYDYLKIEKLLARTEEEHINCTIYSSESFDLYEAPKEPFPDYEGSSYFNEQKNTHLKSLNLTTPDKPNNTVENPSLVPLRPVNDEEITTYSTTINGEKMNLTQEQHVRLHELSVRIESEKEALDKLNTRIVEIVGEELANNPDIDSTQLKNLARALPPEKINEYAELISAGAKIKEKYDELRDTMIKTLELYQAQNRLDEDITRILNNDSVSASGSNSQN